MNEENLLKQAHDATVSFYRNAPENCLCLHTFDGGRVGNTRQWVLLGKGVHILSQLVEQFASLAAALGDDLDKVDQLLAASLILCLEL